MSLERDLPTAWRLALPQGLRGHHALFEPEMVRFTMQREDAPVLGPESVRRLKSLLEAVEGAQDDGERRDWIAGAPLAVQEMLVRAYFDTLFDYLEERVALVN